MPLPISSPNISVLDFAILYDISGAIPAITLTNQSVGVPSGTTGLNLCTWWYSVVTPSGYVIHQGSATTPDYPPSASSWTTLAIPQYSWPTPFGTAPCGQVEFSSAVPYVCTLYVKDTLGNIYQLAKTTIICAPNGNIPPTSNWPATCGSFGGANVAVKTLCNTAQVYAADTTDYTYQGLIGTSSGSIWTLRYPQGASGVIPPNAVVNNAPNVYFPIGYSGKGYTLYLNTTAAYNLGNSCSVKIQYKLYDDDGVSAGVNFSVYCNIDLCALDCKIQELYKLASTNCAEVTDPALAKKIDRILLLMTRVQMGISQPLCGIDVPGIIEEIQKIGGFQCDCMGGSGINIGSAVPPSSGGCCPISTPVIDFTTGNPPLACPQSYFPVTVLDPTKTTPIGSASNINDLVAILNANPAWNAYGSAFAEGNCVVGWFLSNAAAIPPNPNINPGAVVINPSAYVDPIVIIGSISSPPPGCPVGSPYPVKVYDPTHTTVIGIANSINDVVSLLNSTGAWAAYGVASVQDNCHVQFNLTNPSIIPPYIFVDPNVTSATCTSNTAVYLIEMIDPCYPNVAITSSDFPCNLYYDWGLGAGSQSAGIVTSFTNVVSVLNAAAGKPASLTFSLSTTPNAIQVSNSNCTAYPDTPTVYCNAGSNNFILFGANHTSDNGLTAQYNGVVALSVATNAALGRIPGATPTKHMWHEIQIGNYLIVAEGDTGKIYFYDVTNPLSPSLARTIQLNDTGSGNCFTGNPHTITWDSGGVAVPSFFSLYFPTDTYSSMSLSAIYVFEGTTGSAWLINFTGSGSGVTSSFVSNSLLGMCPRILYNGLIFFTWDGDLAAAGGLSPGLPPNEIPILQTSTFNSSGILTFSPGMPTGEYVWAASYDGAGHIYWTGQHGSLTITNTNPLSPIQYQFYPNIFGTYSFFKYRLNTNIIGPLIWFSSLNFEFGSPPVLSPLPVGNVANMLSGTPTVGYYASLPGTKAYYNVCPVGACLVAIVSASAGTTSAPSQLIFITKKTADVAVIAQINVPEGYLYNTIAIPSTSTTPNSFVLP